MNEYLIHLLYENNCVIIPKVGAFVANYKSAYVDMHQNIIYPPQKTIAFNKQLNKNDGLLVAYISEQQMISYTSAEQKVKQFGEEVMLALDKHKNFIFNDIGRLYKNTDNNILFESFGQNYFLIDNYGLLPVAVEPVSRLKATPQVFLEAVMPVSTTETKNKKSAWLKWALPVLIPFLLIIIIGSVIIFGQFNFKNIKSEMACVVPSFQYSNDNKAIDKSEEVNNTNGSITENNVNEIVDSIIAKNTKSAQTEVVKIETTTETTKIAEVPMVKELPKKELIRTEDGQVANVFICVGSFKNEVNARELQKKINIIGLKSVVKRTSYHQVLVATSSKRLVEDLATLKDEISQDVFIYCQNCNY